MTQVSNLQCSLDSEVESKGWEGLDLRILPACLYTQDTDMHTCGHTHTTHVCVHMHALPHDTWIHWSKIFPRIISDEICR